MALKGWHLNLETENKHNPRQNNRKLAVHRKPKQAVYKSPVTVKALEPETVSNLQSASFAPL